MTKRITRTGGRPAIEGVIKGRYALSVGDPGEPVAPGWKWVPLTSLARLESGHTPSRRHPEYWHGDIPWIGIRDATANHGRTLNDTAQHTNNLGIANSSARLLPTNTVCLSRTASVGYVVVMGRPMATSQDFVNWVCSDQLDHQFLKYVLLAEHDTFLSFASGTTHQTIYYPEVKAFHVCLPAVDVQRKIAAFLGSVDNLIENNRQRVEVLEEMARRIYREWFVHYRYPGHEDDAGAGSAVGRLPSTWEAGRVADLVLLQRGFDLPVGDRRQGEVPIIAASGHGGWHDRAQVPGPGVVTGRSGSVGSTTYVDVDFWPLNTALWIKEYRRSTPRHAYFLLGSLDLRGMAGGATMPMLNRNVVHSTPVALPPRDLIQNYDRIVLPMFEERFALSREADCLADIRSMLLPKLVTGQIDVSDLDLDALTEAATA